MKIFLIASIFVTSSLAGTTRDSACPDLAVSCKAATCRNWSYEESSGPTSWSTLGYTGCADIEQSPINLVTKGSTKTSTGPVKLGAGYSGAISGTWLNDGETVKFTPTSPETLTLTGGAYGNDVYQLAQFHFHWGCENNQGSEHTIDGKRFALELHLVHWKKSYGTFADASTKRDGLAVLGVLFQAKDLDRKEEDLFRNFQCARDPDSTTAGSIHLNDILGKANLTKYFNYMGSLTTPPCSQVVIWTVLANPLIIHTSEMKNLRSLDSCRCEEICDNFRPVQSLGSRTLNFNH